MKRIIPHVLQALLFFSLTLGQEVIFHQIAEIPFLGHPIEKYLIIYIFFLSATFIHQTFLRFFFLSFIFVLNFFQMAHLSYFGTQILPGEILLLFTQTHEIMGTVTVEKHHTLIPLALTIIPLFLGIIFLKKIPPRQSSKWMGYLFCLYLIYNPIRTFVTGNTWGRQPSTRQLGGMNVYLSLSYFLGKLLPHKLSKTSYSARPNSSLELKLDPQGVSDWDNIIFILGESLSPHHMSLFGYDKPTTPYLVGLKKNKNFFYRMGLSSGVSTDISVAFMMNMGFGEAGAVKASKGDHCLFRLAKQKKFTTYFLSTQSSQQLRYITPYLCTSQIDVYKSLEIIDPGVQDDQSCDDKILLPELKKIIDQNQKNFIVLHQRGSHAPWEVRSLAKNRVFPHDNKINHYNNSVVEFDLFFKELNQILSQTKKKSLVIYVSDHGEAMGQDGRWGHGQLIKVAMEIPVLVMSFNHDLNLGSRDLPSLFTHYNATLILAKELGFHLNQDPFILPKDFMVYGNDIDGFSGKGEILFRPDGTYDLKLVE